MAYTQAQLLNLEVALTQGVLTVEYDGPPKRMVTYQSVAAMTALRAQMIRELNKPPAFRHASFSSGFNPPRGSGGEGSSSGGGFFP